MLPGFTNIRHQQWLRKAMGEAQFSSCSLYLEIKPPRGRPKCPYTWMLCDFKWKSSYTGIIFPGQPCLTLAKTNIHLFILNYHSQKKAVILLRKSQKRSISSSCLWVTVELLFLIVSLNTHNKWREAEISQATAGKPRNTTILPSGMWSSHEMESSGPLSMDCIC